MKRQYSLAIVMVASLILATILDSWIFIIPAVIAFATFEKLQNTPGTPEWREIASEEEKQSFDNNQRTHEKYATLLPPVKYPKPTGFKARDTTAKGDQDAW